MLRSHASFRLPDQVTRHTRTRRVVIGGIRGHVQGSIDVLGVDDGHQIGPVAVVREREADLHDDDLLSRMVKRVNSYVPLTALAVTGNAIAFGNKSRARS